MDTSSSEGAGWAAGVAAYAAWGLLPLYWHLLRGVPAGELLCHRIGWSAIGLTAGLAAAGRLAPLLRRLDAGTVRATAVAALLVGANWLLFVWGATHDRVVEVALGYFLNPLVSVALGVVVLGERLTRGQVGALLVAGGGVGVALLGSSTGVPWLAVALAFSFAGYGLAKKRAPLPALEGLWLETALLAGPCALGLIALTSDGSGAFGHRGPRVDALLIGTGLVTSLPMWWFGIAARRIPLTWVGMLQYIAPSLQLVLGVLVFHEPFGWGRALSFALVWLGLALWVLVTGIRR